jgi:hypothetical protein
MATTPRTKAPAAKATASAKSKGTAAKGKAAAPKAAESTAVVPSSKKPEKLLDAHTFVTFQGYATELPQDERVFEKDQVLYIISVEETADSVRYAACKADEVAAYLSDGEDAVDGGEVAHNEVRELKGSALEKAQDAYMPVTVVGHLQELMDDNSEDPIAVARALNSEIAESYFWMGGSLAIILQTGAHLKENGGEYEGEDAFNEFCQTEFGFKASKGRALARIYLTYSKLEGFDPTALGGIGWSKVSIAERFVTSENVEEVLALAAESTQNNLPMVLKEKYETAAGTTASGRAASRQVITKKTIIFKLEEAAAETVELAIKYGMTQFGIASADMMIERICSEWASEHLETKAHKEKIAAKVKVMAKQRQAAEAEKAPAKTTTKKAA